MQVQCSTCEGLFERKEASIKTSRAKHNGLWVCFKCSWNTPEMKEKQRLGNLTSEAFKASRAIVSQKLSGAGNPMFGKTVSPKQSAKMSASRTGKTGPNATAWKGGKGSLLARVKARIYQQHQWAKKIYERDNWICTSCGSTKKLDAHHTTPFATLLKEVKAQTELQGDGLIDWLANHPALKDAQGITLCRECHRVVHQNWGSHNPETQDVQV